jgi:hypothetical protein
MAVPAYAHWEVRTDGHNDNGGCFNPTRSGATKTWDDNYTYGPSYMVVIYDGQSGNEPKLTPNGTALNQVRCNGGRAFVQADVGHVIKIIGGVNVTPGRYEITSVSSGVATLDANCWTSTSGSEAVARLGGAVAHPSEAILQASGSNFVWVKSGTYIFTSTVSRSWSWLRLHIRGYSQSRLDMGTPPVFQAGAASITLLHTTNSDESASSIWNIKFSGGGYAGVTGFGGQTANQHMMYKCVFEGLSLGYYATRAGWAVACTFINCSTGVSGGYVVCCSAVNCSTVGIEAHFAYCCTAMGCAVGFRSELYGVGTFINCVARNCTGIGFDGNDSRGGGFINCVAVSCGGHGFRAHSRNHFTYNCIATNCSQYGFYFEPGVQDMHSMLAVRLAGYANTSGNYGNISTTWGFTWGLRQILTESLIDLTQTPFESVPLGDLRLNNVPGGGMLCRGDKETAFGNLYNPDLGLERTFEDPTKIFVLEDD